MHVDCTPDPNVALNAQDTVADTVTGDQLLRLKVRG